MVSGRRVRWGKMHSEEQSRVCEEGFWAEESITVTMEPSLN